MFAFALKNLEKTKVKSGVNKSLEAFRNTLMCFLNSKLFKRTAFKKINCSNRKIGAKVQCFHERSK